MAVATPVVVVLTVVTTGFPEGGGGGSFNSGNNQVNFAGSNVEDGIVIIRPLSTGALNDVGVVGIDSPTVFCPGIHNVYASINNFGISQITSATVNWEVDGVLQSAATFNGFLDTIGGTSSTSGQVLLGSYNFATNNPYTITAWTSSPNGSADTVSANDSASVTVQSNLPPPTGLNLVSVTGLTATVDWNPGSLSNSWLWVVELPGQAPSGIGTASSNAVANITGLTPKSSYDFYVREVCPTGDTSSWAGPLTFTTPFFCPPGSFCFTNCGASGQFGPDQAACNSAYNGTLLQGQVNVIGGIQEWTFLQVVFMKLKYPVHKALDHSVVEEPK